MRYLKKAYQQDFPHQISRGDLTLHLAESASADIIEPIASMLAQRGDQSVGRSMSGCLAGSHSRLFVKTVALESLPTRFRVTLGLQRRAGGYDWPIAELMNTVGAHRLGAPVPRLKGFGYLRRGRRLARELFLISEMLDEHVDGKHWLGLPDQPIEPFLHGAFDLLHDLHAMQVCHLDLWAGNIMLDPARLGAMKAVDLENCYIGRPVHLAELLGFQFGFLYLRLVKDHIEEAHYDLLVAEALYRYPGLDQAKFHEVYAQCKHRQISRKKRTGLLLRGDLQIK